jgi:hypothetical protein
LGFKGFYRFSIRLRHVSAKCCPCVAPELNFYHNERETEGLTQMAKLDLNAKKLAALKSEATRIQIFDDDQPGLAIRISPDGTKSFSVVYRFRGRWRWLTIGKYPTVSLAEARSRTREALRDIERGEDPMAKKVAVREAGTFEELAKLTWTSIRRPRSDRGPKTRECLMRIFCRA